MPRADLDVIDRRILVALQEDARLTNVELAAKVGLSPSPCLRRVRSLEARGVIERYAAKLNRQRVGLGVTAFVSVNIERHRDTDAAKFREAVLAMPEVVACYITSGEADFLLQVTVADLDAYRVFALKKIMHSVGVKSVHSSFVIDVVKDNVPMPLDHLR
jgi:Lrp/AsnC family transcriptional regulator, leucine-responsive regulatory protein